jgi:phosphatidate phosphatase APP1
VHGRAVERSGIAPSADTDSKLKNLLNSYRRVRSGGLAHARLAVTFAGTTAGLPADDEGFFGGWLELPQPLATQDEWNEYTAELLTPVRPGGARVIATGEILVPPPTATFGVISDIDDTVIQSHVSNFLQAAHTILLGNARTRLPFPGVAAFYRALRDGASAAGSERNPIFYVSSSPWNIYDVIAEFLELQRIPRGPLLLRDWDVGFGALGATRHFDHKGEAIRGIMHLYPELPFILIGDTSQHDPEIYHQIVREFPDRVRAVYIRDVTRAEDRTSAVRKLGEELLAVRSTLVLSEDTLGAARHAAQQGWIRGEAVGEIEREAR